MQLSVNVFADLQIGRVGSLLEKINDQKSLTNAQVSDELISSLTDKRLSGLYENKVDELNIDFTVQILPFPLEVLDPRIVRIAPGKANELHRHAHETVFIFLEGEGKVVVDDFQNSVKPGDFAFIPRWCNHQSINTGNSDLVFLAVADFGLTGKSFVGNYLKTARMKTQSPNQ
jgi:mannose-6-phosphate isomerase-like protein (cupin superfamily)